MDMHHLCAGWSLPPGDALEEQETVRHSCTPLPVPPHFSLHSRYLPLWHAFLMSNLTRDPDITHPRCQNFTQKNPVKLKLNTSTLAETLPKTWWCTYVLSAFACSTRRSVWALITLNGGERFMLRWTIYCLLFEKIKIPKNIHRWKYNRIL